MIVRTAEGKYPSFSSLLVIYALNLRPLNLDILSLDRARMLDGKPVTVSFVVAKLLFRAAP
ncbi:MAG: hypothetical protein K8U57_18615 [Planctomycetes bacterium]|nr:hypothetical protein [Planctomycetota bacterium]